jgi:hypothetical protein
MVVVDRADDARVTVLKLLKRCSSTKGLVGIQPRYASSHPGAHIRPVAFSAQFRCLPPPYRQWHADVYRIYCICVRSVSIDIQRDNVQLPSASRSSQADHRVRDS